MTTPSLPQSGEASDTTSCTAASDSFTDESMTPEASGAADHRSVVDVKAKRSRTMTVAVAAANLSVPSVGLAGYWIIGDLLAPDSDLYGLGVALGLWLTAIVVVGNLGALAATLLDRRAPRTAFGIAVSSAAVNGLCALVPLVVLGNTVRTFFG